MAGRRFTCRSALTWSLTLLAAPSRSIAAGVLRSSYPLDAAGPRGDFLAPLGRRPKSPDGASAAPVGNRSVTYLLDEALLWQKDIFDHPKARDPGSAIFGSASAADWVILLATVVGLATLDFFVVQRFSAPQAIAHGITSPADTGCRSSSRRHVAVLIFWVLVGLAFNGLIWLRRGHQAGLEWCSGYFLEWLLSMDNLFVFHLVFQSYKTPKELLHKALFLGVLGAALFRMCFFMALSSLLHLVHWIRFIFGILLIYSGIQAAQSDSGEEMDLNNTVAIRVLRRILGTRICDRYEGQRLFVHEDGQVRATLLVPVIVCLEATDILFAADSVSAKVAQIPDYYIAYSSSVIAIFGLRAMFFIIQDLVDCFDLMTYALCFILVFIGAELMVSDYVKLPAQVVCVIILSVFAVAAVGSTAKGLYTSAAHSRESAPEAERDLVKG